MDDRIQAFGKNVCNGSNMRTKVILTLIALISGLTATTTQYVTAQQPQEAPKPHQKEMWIRYLRAGEQAHGQHRDDLAKRYYLAALTALEKSYGSTAATVSQNKHPVPHQAGQLEQDLTDQYPKDWSKQKGDPNKHVQLQEEQVAVLSRINNFNQAHHANQLLIDQYQRAYSKASEDLEKTKAKTDAAKPAGTDSAKSAAK